MAIINANAVIMKNPEDIRWSIWEDRETDDSGCDSY